MFESVINNRYTIKTERFLMDISLIDVLEKLIFF